MDGLVVNFTNMTTQATILGKRMEPYSTLEISLNCTKVISETEVMT